MKAAGASRHGREDLRLEPGLVHGAATPYTLQSGETCVTAGIGKRGQLTNVIFQGDVETRVN